VRVTCSKCGATVTATVSSLPPAFRWGTNDLPTISGQCHAVKAGAVVSSTGTFACGALDAAVLEAATGVRS
jgi:hypothetical protein